MLAYFLAYFDAPLFYWGLFAPLWVGGLTLSAGLVGDRLGLP